MIHFDHEFFGILSTALKLLAFAPYILSLTDQKTKPHLFTWLIWSLVMGIVFIIQVTEGAGPGAWAIGISSFAYLGVAIYAYYRGEKNITRSDLASVIFALCVVPVWYVTKNDILALALMGFIDLAAYYPTCRKSWHKPMEEPAIPFAMSSVALFLSIFALDTVNFVTVFYPVALGLTDGLFATMLVYRRNALKSQEVEQVIVPVSVQPAKVSGPAFAVPKLAPANDRLPLKDLVAEPKTQTQYPIPSLNKEKISAFKTNPVNAS